MYNFHGHSTRVKSSAQFCLQRTLNIFFLFLLIAYTNYTDRTPNQNFFSTAVGVRCRGMLLTTLSCYFWRVVSLSQVASAIKHETIRNSKRFGTLGTRISGHALEWWAQTVSMWMHCRFKVGQNYRLNGGWQQTGVESTGDATLEWHGIWRHEDVLDRRWD